MGGCFVACFGGVSNKKKPSRKPSQRFLIRDIIHGSYQPLEEDLEDSVIPEQPSSPIPLISSNKVVTAKIKKKVRFDLNVQIYEPTPLQDKPDSSEDTTVSEGTSDWDPSGRTLPLNNRYQNCRDTYYDDEEEEEDEFVLADSDFEFESDDDLDSFDDESLLMPLGQKNSTEEDAPPFPRGRFVESVLNPVENLTQWKAIKAKESKCRSKENIAVEKNKITTPNCDLEELKSQCLHKKRDNMSLFSN